ncbi:hypothetical protein Taro_017212 [Colocasia esculenta]|uniref:MADS-box domain-containing protein n=1 Tax=Colocasia esculenta TaxID=4460 RepID=A0A843UFQ1_COLES|nr:hypothetical protein [Colocasia esculenta]
MVRSKINLKLIGDKKRRKNTFINRRSGLENKARELSILCDIPVLLVCFGPQGQDGLIWPEERMEAYAIAERFRSANAEDCLMRTVDVSTFFGNAVMKQAAEEGVVREEERDLPYSSEERHLDLMPESSLQELEQALEARLREIEERMAALRRGGDGFHLRGDEQDAADRWQAQLEQEGLQALQHYDLTWSNPHGGEETLQGVGGYWGNPTGGGFDVDPSAFLRGLHQNLQPLLHGGAAAPPPAYTSTSFEAPPLQAYGENYMGTMTYMSSSMTYNPHLSAGASVGYPYYPDGYGALNYLNSFNMVYSAPAITPTAFMPPRSSAAAFLDYGGVGTGSAQPCVTRFPHFRCQVNAAGGGGAREQAASSSNNGDGRVHCLGDLYGDGLGFLRDEPIE